MEARKTTRSKPKTKKLVPRGKRVSVADRVKARKRMDEVQREIEDISRRIETEKYLGEIVKLRRLFEEKDNERDRLYKEVQNKAKNEPKNVPDVVKKTLQERRANNKTKKNMKEQMQKEQMQNEIRPRINAPTLKLRDRKALNLERMYQLKKKDEFAPEDETAHLLKEMQTWVKPKVEYVSEKAYYSMKEEDDVPKELRSMIIRAKPPKRPKPKGSNVSL